MMLHEFIERTGITPLPEEYEAIEQQYYNYDGDKDAFCEEFLENDGYDKLLKRRAAEIEKLNGKILELERQLRIEGAKYEAQISRLKEELEREQEWKPYTCDALVKQDEYDSLKHSGREMTDGEAAEWLAQEFGFAPDKIRVGHMMAQYEINRHRQLRKVGEYDRRPLYGATDWYYVWFTVCGYTYEAHNGTLTKI